MIKILAIAPADCPQLRFLARFAEQIELQVSEDPAIVARLLPEAEVLLSWTADKTALQKAFLEASKLKWMHSAWAGLDKLLFPELVESRIQLTNARGVFARALSEFVIGGALYFAKEFRRLEQQKIRRVWQKFDVRELHGKTMGIFGCGAIGLACAHKAKAFGMRVVGLTRDTRKLLPQELVDATLGRNDLPQLCRVSDFFVITAPLTEETRGIIGAGEIAYLRSTAVLINVGRGAIVNEVALIDALKTGQIRGAALDVVTQEPLSPESDLWQLDNVLLSPHCADHVETWLDDAMQLFVENLERYIAGDDLLNVVDKTKGY